MNSDIAASVALILSLFSAVVLPLLKMLWDWWKESGTSAAQRDKQQVEKIATFADEWRELYERMEGKVTRLETELDDMKKNNDTLRSEKKSIAREKLTLEDRVAGLERDFDRLRKAFEFLAETVEPTYPEAVAKARRIVKGQTVE